MNIFDYMYYRFYQSDRKRGANHVEASLEAMGALCATFAGLTSPIIILLVLHFFPLNKMEIIWIFGPIYIVLPYFRFRNKIELFNKKYKDCRLNKYISDYFLWLFILLFWAIGAGVVALAVIFLGL